MSVCTTEPGAAWKEQYGIWYDHLATSVIADVDAMTIVARSLYTVTWTAHAMMAVIIIAMGPSYFGMLRAYFGMLRA